MRNVSMHNKSLSESCQELKRLLAEEDVCEEDTLPGSPKNALGADAEIRGAPRTPDAHGELVAPTLAQPDSDGEGDSLAVEDPYAMPTAVEDPYWVPVGLGAPVAAEPKEAASDLSVACVESLSVARAEVADKTMGSEAFRPVATPQRVESDAVHSAASTIAATASVPRAKPSPTPSSEVLSTTDGSPATPWTPSTEVPDEDDPQASKPQPGALRLSKEAIDGRLRRIMTPNAKGEYQVSQQVLKQYHSKKGKESLRKLFQSCGWDKD